MVLSVVIYSADAQKAASLMLLKLGQSCIFGHSLVPEAKVTWSTISMS